MTKGGNIPDGKVEVLTIRAIATDGGTAYVEVRLNGDDWNFYVDGRTGSSCRGEVFTQYPTQPDAMMLNPDSELAQSIKSLYGKELDKHQVI